MTETEPGRLALTLPDVKAAVEIHGVQGFLPRVVVNGERVRPVRGAYPIPVGKDSSEPLTLRGFIPGFQKVFFRGEEVGNLAEGVGLPERVVMFAPALLILLGSPTALIVALALFFLSLLVVKNLAMPRVLRIGLPIVNTVAAGVLLIMVASSLAASAAK